MLCKFDGRWKSLENVIVPSSIPFQPRLEPDILSRNRDIVDKEAIRKLFTANFTTWVIMGKGWKRLGRRLIKDNTTLVCRLAMWLICTFLRMVWGGEKGEGIRCRYASVPNLIWLSVRYDSVLSTLRMSLALNLSLVSILVIKALFCATSPLYISNAI